jgi:hypothetical protein
MWANFFHDGGWGMYPTSLFGFFLLATAMIFALRPERRFLPAVWCLAGITVAAGVLGTSTGLVNTFRYLPQAAAADQLPIMAAGCAESLNNVVLGLVVVIISLLVTLAGAVRVAVAPPAAA